MTASTSIALPTGAPAATTSAAAATAAAAVAAARKPTKPSKAACIRALADVVPDVIGDQTYSNTTIENLSQKLATAVMAKFRGLCASKVY